MYETEGIRGTGPFCLLYGFDGATHKSRTMSLRTFIAKDDPVLLVIDPSEEFSTTDMALIKFHTRASPKEKLSARFDSYVWLLLDEKAIDFSQKYYGHKLYPSDLETLRDNLREKLRSSEVNSATRFLQALHECELHPNRETLVYECFKMLAMHLKHRPRCGVDGACMVKGIGTDICIAANFDWARLGIKYMEEVPKYVDEKEELKKKPKSTLKRTRDDEEVDEN